MTEVERDCKAIRDALHAGEYALMANQIDNYSHCDFWDDYYVWLDITYPEIPLQYYLFRYTVIHYYQFKRGYR